MNELNTDLRKLPFSSIVKKVEFAAKQNNVAIYLIQEIKQGIKDKKLDGIKKLSGIIVYLNSFGLSKQTSIAIVLDAVELAVLDLNKP